jgi:RyR domain
LARYLTNREFDNICNGWDAQQFDYETTITTDQIIPEKNTYGTSIMDDSQYQSIALDLAKSEHSKWYKDKTNQGWEYGAYLSIIDKKHPLLLPWEQLPEAHKTVDLHSPQNIINILQQQGFTLVKTTEFESLIRLIKSVH